MLKKNYILKILLILGIILIVGIYFSNGPIIAVEDENQVGENNTVEDSQNQLTTNNLSVQNLNESSVVNTEDSEPITQAKKNVGNLKIVLSQEYYSYTGSAIKPKVSVYDGSTKLKESRDYTLKYQNNVNAGKASVIIKGIGNYEGRVKKKYKIGAKKVKFLKINIPNTKYYFRGTPRYAKVIVYDGKKKLKVNKHYKVRYKCNTKTGRAIIKITGKGNYKDTVVRYFYIVPNSTYISSVSLNSSETRATIKWNRDKRASGYAIYAAKSKNGYYRRVRIVSGTYTTTASVGGLNPNKNYYFKIRSYVLVNGKRVYSDKYSRPKCNTGLIASAMLNYPASGSNRNYNMKLASSKINGLVLEPGDTFNWFRVVGRASREKGYKQAGIFVNKITVLGYGGGVCQVSSTVYNACKNAGLRIVERHTHSKAVSYISSGNDATVAYGSKNLIIRNNKDYSIKMVTYTEGTKTFCKLYRVTD